jgi:phage baseplate assembly protein W
MAKIDLNNLIRPKQVNSPDTKLSEEVLDKKSVYTDLHLDIKISKSVGIGFSTINSKDILVDEDILAIKNSIKNIFSTKKGEKILAPEFGSSLEQYLFQPVSESFGRLIAQEIINDLTTYEPRVEVEKVKVLADPDKNQYDILIAYRFLEIKKQSTLSILALQGGELIF